MFRKDVLATTVFALVLVGTGLGVTSREASNRAICHNNLRQLGVAAFEYAEEHDGVLPPRRATPNTWIQKLKEYYGSDLVVQCPVGKDMELTQHSYLINGFNDYFQSTLTPDQFNNIYMSWLWPRGMRPDAIPEPCDTILFGEKLIYSAHVHVDFALGTGNDFDEIDHARHFKSSGRTAGASNHTFADGSVRLLSYGAAVNPVNMWAIVPEYRTNAPISP